MRHTGTRPWVAAGAFAALLMVLVTWLLVIGPARSSTQTLRDDTLAVQQQNQVLQARSNQLRKLSEDRGAIEAGVRNALQALPGDVSLPDLNQQLAQHADAQGVVLSSISVGAAIAPAAATGGAVPAGLLSVPITIQTRGPALSQRYFLKDIQQTGPRAALVSATSLNALDEGDIEAASTMTTQLTVFATSLSASDRTALTTALGADPGTG